VRLDPGGVTSGRALKNNYYVFIMRRRLEEQNKMLSGEQSEAATSQAGCRRGRGGAATRTQRTALRQAERSRN